MKSPKSYARVLASTAAAIACLLALTGCPGPESTSGKDNPVDMAICYTAVQNFPTVDTAAYEPYIDVANENRTIVSVVSLSGSPATVDSIQCGSDDGSSIRRKQENEAKKAQLISDFETMGAAPELNIVDGFDEAARCLPNGGTIVFVSNGISTAGTVKVADILYGDAPAMAEYYAQKGMLPDLSGIHVEWYGIGQVADDQAKPPIAARTQLKDIWTAIIESAGGTVTFHDEPVALAQAQDHAALPDVAEVEWQAEEFHLPTDGPIVLTDAQLAFTPDSATFADEEQATVTLGVVATLLEENPSARATIVGETPSYPWDEQYSLTLSQSRADAIKDWLITKAGIAADRIVAEGIGDTGHDDSDLDKDTGLQIPEEASKYRRCTLTLS